MSTDSEAFQQRYADGACMLLRHAHRSPVEGYTAPSRPLHHSTALLRRRSPVMSSSPPWTSTLAKDYLSQGRDWMRVEQFMGCVIAGDATWQDLTDDPNSTSSPNTVRSTQVPIAEPLTSSGGSEPAAKAVERKGLNKKDRKTYKLTIAYAGHAFHGWAYQPDEVSDVEGVQGHISTSEELRRRLQAVFRPPNALILEAAGRTDSGVHGHSHVTSFYSWDAVSPERISQLFWRVAYRLMRCELLLSVAKHDAHPERFLKLLAVQAINQPTPPTGKEAHPAYLADSLRCLDCQVVPRSFHATFSCEWRRYMYLLPLTQEDANHYRQQHQDDVNRIYCGKSSDRSSETEWAAIAEAVDDMLSWLQGQQLDYFAFGRSTPKGRSCVCTMLHASAKLLYIPHNLNAPNSWTAAMNMRDTFSHSDETCMKPADTAVPPNDQKVPVVCIQLIADRYVRRMVRTLVATVVMSAVWNEPTRLKDAIHSRERRETAYPAPATGLSFTGAGYDDHAPVPLNI